MSLQRLSAVDMTYLEAEEARVPLHVASIGIFEAGPLLDAHGALRLGELRERIEGRLDLLPRLRQRVMPVPYGIARPVWVDDERFAIANHVETTHLEAPGDEAALLRLVERVVMTPLPRDHSLWHMLFVTGLEGDRVALVERAHHAMVDGVSGVDVSLVLLDQDRDSPAVVDTGWEPRPAPSAARLLLDAIADIVSAPIQLGRRAFAELAPQQAAGHARHASQVLATLRTSGVRAPIAPINQQVGAERRIALVREQFADVRAAGAKIGATVNDVVLNAVAGGVRALYVARGEELPTDATVKVLVPVSVRSSVESMALGNRVGALLMPVPIGIGDTASRLAAIADKTAELKASSEASASTFLLELTDLLPPSLSAAVGRTIHHQPFVNTVVTNVPGPPMTLYAMGARMLEAFPIVPLGGNMDVEVAVLSYDGALTLGITADRATCPDVDAMVEGIEQTFRQMGAPWSPATVELD